MKFAKALILSVVFAAPVAICANAVQAKTVSTQPHKVAMATNKKPHVVKHTDCLLREATAEFGNLKTRKEGNQLFLLSGGCQPCPPNSGSTKLGLWVWKAGQRICFPCSP